MKWNEAFNQTLKDFGISAKWLSQESGISEVFISQFRKGRKDATTGVLAQLLEPLPLDAKKQFFGLLLGTIPQPEYLFEEVLESLPKEKKKKLAIQLVESIAREPELISTSS
ncbi:MAG TPA: hypothetical protein DD379_23765 [Cyanobacteria bacterium UBA11162]|nr:hypothetical protein [Cyanobacteria bacterium UBA11162]